MFQRVPKKKIIIVAREQFASSAILSPTPMLANIIALSGMVRAKRFSTPRAEPINVIKAKNVDKRNLQMLTLDSSKAKETNSRKSNNRNATR